MVKLERLDHLVLTVHNLESTCSFYTRVLGMEVVIFNNNRIALTYGSQKINLHEFGKEFEPKAGNPTPGSADLCFVTDWPLTTVIQHLQSCGIDPIEGPVIRTGALGPLHSIYFRDPDRNLIEIANDIH